MEVWNGGREEIGSDVSSSSGTIVSTTYTSSASRPSTTLYMEAAIHFDSLEIHGEEEEHNVHDYDYDGGGSKTLGRVEAEEELIEYIDPLGSITKIKEKKRRDRIRILVQEFCIVPSANCSDVKVGDISVMERWLTELGVRWVLSLDDGVSARVELEGDVRSWTRALDEFVRTICFMWTLFPDCSSLVLPSICDEGEQVGETCILDRYQLQLVLFTQGTMLKMLTFVGVIVAWDPNLTEEFLLDPVMPPSYNKLIALLGVHEALSKASNMIVLELDPPTSVEVHRIENEMVVLLSANKSIVGEAIRSTMEKIRTKLMGDGDDYSSASLNPHESSDIHDVTRSVMAYIRFLWANYRSVHAAIHGKYVPRIENLPPLDSMIIEMVSCLEEKLANISDSFPDQGLRFLFLLNNLNNIQQQVNSLQARKLLALDLTHKVEGHVERYVELSWAQMLSCLFNPTPLCFGKNYSSLLKFEFEFQKIYTTQKQWKVPDPSLRIRLRKAITDKFIPGYTEYLEDSKVTGPKFTPQELEEMLQGLFEG